MDGGGKFGAFWKTVRLRGSRERKKCGPHRSNENYLALWANSDAACAGHQCVEADLKTGRELDVLENLLDRFGFIAAGRLRRVPGQSDQDSGYTKCQESKRQSRGALIHFPKNLAVQD